MNYKKGLQKVSVVCVYVSYGPITKYPPPPKVIYQATRFISPPYPPTKFISPPHHVATTNAIIMHPRPPGRHIGIDS